MSDWKEVDAWEACLLRREPFDVCQLVNISQGVNFWSCVSGQVESDFDLFHFKAIFWIIMRKPHRKQFVRKEVVRHNAVQVSLPTVTGSVSTACWENVIFQTAHSYWYQSVMFGPGLRLWWYSYILHSSFQRWSLFWHIHRLKSHLDSHTRVKYHCQAKL